MPEAKDVVSTKEKDLLSQVFFFGGDGRDRTDDLLNAIQALSQLSYAPKGIAVLNSVIDNTITSGKCQHFFPVFRKNFPVENSDRGCAARRPGRGRDAGDHGVLLNRGGTWRTAR